MIIIISSPSGAGKTSICKELLKKDDKLRISISDTTRIPRDNEVNNHDYNFISEESFKKKIANQEYAEYALVFGNYYGSLHKHVLRLLNEGFDVLFDIDWQGAVQLKNSNYKNILSFFITPPSKDVLYQRLLSRAKISGDNELDIANRMSFYEKEISHMNEYDYVIENKELNVCVREIRKIITKKRINFKK